MNQQFSLLPHDGISKIYGAIYASVTFLETTNDHLKLLYDYSDDANFSPKFSGRSISI
jgi:hypothetical protein